ncbi:sigma-E processing peptidase SpoIIGA [Clostridium gasigenes]|uniref:sigma-E processing peptidase SpoIIGA n=1 Tax=Clostridium gasigenes TaxID=94869 RepID=UPI001C0C66A2|nr:sigma-E processing peptidase SpoIIGA [Clostridium gasigenes]MBU3135606.1 sigma-E processing peptidase SpoIIGA [Clostridium gasigenes]
MVVYIDVLLFENFVVNLFLLLLTFKLLRFSYKKRIYLSAILGSIYTLALFLEWPFGTSFIAKILVAVLMIIIAIEKRKISNILKCVGCFFILSFTLCGVCFSFALMQNKYGIMQKFEMNNYSIKYILISIMILYIVIVRAYEYLRGRIIVKSLIYDIEISVNKNIFYIKGFLDTGNDLREPVTNLPCIIVEDGYLNEVQLPEKEYFNISYSTIGDSGKIKGFKGEKIRIKSQDEDWRTVDAIICSCTNKLSKENDFNALLSRGII